MLVNSYTANDQQAARTIAFSDDSWVVTWMSSGQDGSGTGIYQRTFWINDAPTVDKDVADQTASENAPFSFVVPADAFADEDKLDTLSYSATLDGGGTLPTWLIFNPTTRTFSGTPTGEAAGEIVIRLTATDAGGLSVSTTFTLTVNDIPTVANAISAKSADEDAPFTFIFAANTFSDQVRNTLTYSATLGDGSALPGWLTFDAATRTFSGTPANADAGNITIKVTATDAGGLSVTTTFTLTVDSVNDAPIVPGNTTAWTFEDAALPIDVLSAASDEEGNTLTVTAASVLSGFGSVFIDDDGRLVYDPTTAPNQNIADGETRTVVIGYTVSDGNGGTATGNVTVTVNGISPDIFKGTAGNDILNGSIHGDILYGYAGTDTLDGKTGADQMYGGSGNDTYIVDNTKDTVIESANEGTDLVKASVSYTLAANVENLTLTGSGRINGTGNTLTNVLTGNSANNTLDGKAGADRMIGSKGNDTYIVDNVKDVVTEKAGEGTDLVKASVSHTLVANVENLTLIGSGKISGTGTLLRTSSSETAPTIRSMAKLVPIR